MLMIIKCWLYGSTLIEGWSLPAVKILASLFYTQLLAKIFVSSDLSLSLTNPQQFITVHAITGQS
jgi:hypothetical protein